MCTGLRAEIVSCKNHHSLLLNIIIKIYYYTTIYKNYCHLRNYTRLYTLNTALLYIYNRLYKYTRMYSRLHHSQTILVLLVIVSWRCHYHKKIKIYNKKKIPAGKLQFTRYVFRFTNCLRILVHFICFYIRI